MAHDRRVSGVRCSDVLELLPDYVDGGLAEGDVARVEGHLRGCDWCERFGGEYAATVAAIRSRLAIPEPLDAGVRARLAAALDRGA